MADISETQSLCDAIETRMEAAALLEVARDKMADADPRFIRRVETTIQKLKHENMADEALRGEYLARIRRVA